MIALNRMIPKHRHPKEMQFVERKPSGGIIRTMPHRTHECPFCFLPSSSSGKSAG